MPATRLTLLFSCLPLTAVAARETIPGAVSDPRPMLLWYVVIAVPSLMTVFLGVLTTIDFIARRRAEAAKASKEAAAQEKGGLVTYQQLMTELSKVYDTVKQAMRDATAELITDVKQLERTQTQLATDLSHLEGRAEDIPARVSNLEARLGQPRPRTGS